jgi:hypothetical protein
VYPSFSVFIFTYFGREVGLNQVGADSSLQGELLLDVSTLQEDQCTIERASRASS